MNCSNRNTTLRFGVSAIFVLIAFAKGVVQAQPGPGNGGSSSPIQMISNAQFNQMVQAGELTVITPGLLANQAFQRLLVDLRNESVVNQFMRENPNLPGFAQLVAGVPQNPNVFPTIDGAYRTQILNQQGQLQTVETYGQETKLAQLASSILASGSPTQQLALYQSLYSQYTAFYTQICAGGGSITSFGGGGSPAGCANLLVPSGLTNPATLQNAPLATIQTALATLGALALNVIKLAPPPSPAGPVACSAQTGASSVADNVIFGDQTSSFGCTTPSPSGIVANINYPNKNLISCIKNQGARGTCHIFAATSAMEELIARDTGNYVNLSEEDFNENEKLLWGPSYYGDSGDPSVDLDHAAKPPTGGPPYKFAYENQWDYNPSLDQPGPPAYEYQNSCVGYPYPSVEPGCSDSAPQAPQYCTEVPITTLAGVIVVEECGFTPAVVSGPRSPYMTTGAYNIWNPANANVSFDYIILSLAFNNAVILAFGVSHDFEYGLSDGFLTYDPADVADYLGVHIVHLVGYVDNSTLATNPGIVAPPGAGGGYLIIKNSWGSCFGDAGYVYMPVAYLEATALAVYVVSEETH